MPRVGFYARLRVQHRGRRSSFILLAVCTFCVCVYSGRAAIEPLREARPSDAIVRGVGIGRVDFPRRPPRPPFARSARSCFTSLLDAR